MLPKSPVLSLSFPLRDEIRHGSRTAVNSAWEQIKVVPAATDKQLDTLHSKSSS